jgi:hypothetical protein
LQTLPDESLASAVLARTEAVRADHRLRADEKRIRTQSAILYKNNPNTLSLLSVTVFSARSAQWLMSDNA